MNAEEHGVVLRDVDEHDAAAGNAAAPQSVVFTVMTEVDDEHLQIEVYIAISLS